MNIHHFLWNQVIINTDLTSRKVKQIATARKIEFVINFWYWIFSSISLISAECFANRPYKYKPKTKVRTAVERADISKFLEAQTECALPLSDMILAQLDDSAVMMMTVSTLEQYIACFWR